MALTEKIAELNGKCLIKCTEIRHLFLCIILYMIEFLIPLCKISQASF